MGQYAGYNEIRKGKINMTTSMIISTVIECAVGVFLIWSIFNEDKLCDFEDMVAAKIKESIRKRKKRRVMSAAQIVEA